MAPFRSFQHPCFLAFLSAICRYLCCQNSSIRPINEKHGCFSPSYGLELPRLRMSRKKCPVLSHFCPVLRHFFERDIFEVGQNGTLRTPPPPPSGYIIGPDRIVSLVRFNFYIMCQFTSYLDITYYPNIFSHPSSERCQICSLAW